MPQHRPAHTIAHAWQRIHDAVHDRTAHLPPTLRGLLWTSGAGAIFSVLNAVMRKLTLEVDPFQSQFLRYAFGLDRKSVV